jgi:DNA mismatch repair protein MutL
MNNDVIKLLPDSVANQIAAGEVIQRPASVIKELVENAVDAGATAIQIILKDAGKTLIQVVDNGCGMSATDARMAFERHATSKIRKADDLFTLHTMGFRGEALPSIAAVSEIDMRTMRPDDVMGTRIIIKASEVESQQPEACVAGTNIMVKHLFYNFVARRRFLKKDNVELSHIMHEFERLALVNTNVEFTLTHNGTVVHQLLKSPLKQRIGALFGKTVERGLIPVDTETTLVKIAGFIGLPQNARHRNALQYFFVNGRNMRHPYFHKAVLNCYHDLIAADAQPNYFINLSVDPDRIDVNIHPQKHEIKFEDEQMIWQILTAAIKESLGKFNAGPSIDFDAIDVPDIPPMIQTGATNVSTPVDDIDLDYNPFAVDVPTPSGVVEMPKIEVQSAMNNSSSYSQSEHTWRKERSSALNKNWDKLYEAYNVERQSALNTLNQQAKSGTHVQESAVLPTLAEESQEAQAMFQLKNRWIVTTSKSGLMFIDQHRAHTRVLYERFLPTIKSGHMATQHLIFGETVEVDAAQHAIIQSAQELLSTLGYELSFLGNLTWAINGVPAELSGVNPTQALLSVLSDVADTGNDPTDDQRSRIALSMAETAAIRSNQSLTNDEVQRLVSDLFKLPTPNYTPDGYAIIHILSADQIAAFFHK